MVDTVDKETRSRIMRRVRGKDTKPEMLLRKALFARGFRYRLHDHNLPGKPDMVFPKFKAVIFVHGCFWHGHTCSKFRLPKSNINYWIHKIKRNQINDNNHLSKLYSQGWRVLIVWECALASMENYDRIACWLKGDCSDRHPDQLPSVNSINTISKTEIG